MTPFDYACDLLGRGLLPIPVEFGGKAPKYRSWPSLQLRTKHHVAAHFGEDPVNIGVLLGEPSGWIVDIDLDHPKAVALADSALPPTYMVWGRASKPRSHRLYRVSSPVRTHRVSSTGLGSIVELRSTGCQTIAPGSVHLSGEAVQWDEDGEPALLDPRELLDAIGCLGRVCQLDVVSAARTTSCDPVHPIGPIDPVDPLDPMGVAVEVVLVAAEVTGPGQHDRQTFVLARGLRIDCRLASIEAARPHFERWWARAKPHCSEQDDDAAWFKFARAWDEARLPLRGLCPARQALALGASVPAAPEAARYGPKLGRLVSALAYAGILARGEPFAISVYMVRDAIGVDPKTSQEWFKGLEREGLIRVVDRGRPGENGKGRARRIVWIGCQ